MAEVYFRTETYSIACLPNEKYTINSKFRRSFKKIKSNLIEVLCLSMKSVQLLKYT